MSETHLTPFDAMRALLAAMTALGVTHLELTPGDDDHAPPPAADPEPREQARAG